MKFWMTCLLLAALFSTGGCAALLGPKAPIESQESLMTGCIMLGAVSDTADAGLLSTSIAGRLMLQKVQERALQLGATHIVWLHRTDSSAAAKAYRCE